MAEIRCFAGLIHNNEHPTLFRESMVLSDATGENKKV